MLVAVLALILQGAAPAFARNQAARELATVEATHSDCHHGHTVNSAQPHHGDMAVQQSVPRESDHDRMPLPVRQLDCCTATAAIVLPAVTVVRGRDTLVMVFRLASLPMPDGQVPEGPSKPPRTSYPG